MLSKLIDSKALSFPWPTIVNDKKIDGSILHEITICKKCTDKQCRNSNLSGKYTCKVGLSYLICNYKNLNVVVYGIVSDSRDKLPKYTNLKEQLKGRYVSDEEYNLWKGNLCSVVDIIEENADDLLSQVLHPLHDTIRLSGEIHEIALKIIHSDKSKTFEESFTQSNKDIRSLYKASEILIDTFDSASIFFNPEAAKFGKPKNTELYKLLDKIYLIVNAAESNKTSTKIRFEGRGYKAYSLYESFKLLPLAILQNAVNYTQSGDITLRIEENNYFARIYVTSCGPLIEENEKQAIFERTKRGKWAAKLRNDGMGIGLYIANVVALAHDIQINVESEPLKYDINGIPQAKNTFWFAVNSGGLNS